jgi:hypothetical protein
LKSLGILFLLAALAILVSGCAFTVAQSPETVAPGRVVAGGLGSLGLGQGASPAGPLLAGTELGAYGRAGLRRNLDAGVRLSLPAGLGADIKYQVLSRRTRLALGLGASFLPWVAPPLVDSTRRMALGLYPLVVGGSRRAWCGLRGIGLVHYDRGTIARYHVLAGPEFFVGSTVGRGRLQALPELHAWWLEPFHDARRQFGVGFGIAVQYQLKGRFKDYEKFLPGAGDLLRGIR